MNDLFPAVRAAAVQAEPVVFDCEATVAKASRLIVEAAKGGARLLRLLQTLVRQSKAPLPERG